MKLLCRLLGHNYLYSSVVRVTGPGEPLPNGKAACGIPQFNIRYQCTRCKEEKDVPLEPTEEYYKFSNHIRTETIKAMGVPLKYLGKDKG